MVLHSVMKHNGETVIVDVPRGRIPFVCNCCGRVGTCPTSKPKKYCSVECKNNSGVIGAIRQHQAAKMLC